MKFAQNNSPTFLFGINEYTRLSGTWEYVKFSLLSYCPHVEKYVVRINLVHVVIKCPLSTVATTFSVQSCGANHCSMTVSFKCRGEQEKLLGGGYYLWHVCLEENLTVYHLVQHIKHPILRIPNFNFPNLRFCKVFFCFLFFFNTTSYIGIFGCILILI